jgi:hypothetical protein
VLSREHEAYTLDLRQFTGWCRLRSLSLFAVRRADIETFARELESRGRARATVTRRLCTIAGFYGYAVEEELLDHSPAAHVRRPRLDYESHAIEQLGLERGHRTLVITHKGGKVVPIPLAPRTARAIDLAIGERTDGPLSSPRAGGGWTGTAPPGSSAGSPAAPRSPRTSARTRSDTRSSPEQPGQPFILVQGSLATRRARLPRNQGHDRSDHQVQPSTVTNGRGSGRDSRARRAASIAS